MKRYLFPFLSLLCLEAIAQPAALDAQFGNAGLAVYQSTASSEYNCVTTDAQGNIFCAGYISTGPGTGMYRLMITKTLPSGQPDLSFGNNGMTQVTVDASEFPLNLELAPDGKILASGSAYAGHTPNGPGDYRGFVVRLNSNGVLDASFAQGGIYHFTSPDSHFTNILFRSNGSILLCGNTSFQSFVLQLLDNGTPDTQFANNGYFFFNIASFQFLMWNALQEADGSVVSVGYESSDPDNPKLAYCKINAQGSYDLTFGNNGYMSLDLHIGQPMIAEMLTQIRKGSGGKYYMGGYGSANVMLRVNANGLIDSTYGLNGVLSHSYPFKDFVVQQDGKLILAGGKEFSDYNYGWAITRLNADGTIDPGFASGQSLGLDISPDNDYPQALSIVNDQSLFVAGSSRINNVANGTLAKIKLSNTSGIGDKIYAKNIAVYPNPVQQTLNLSADDKMELVELVDMSGRLVQQYPNLHTQSIKINCNFPAGTYVLRVRFKSGESHTQTLIKR
ncbi:MAG: hypothetical protein BGO31_11935 [Bacteroidetes bacterium 43-16]|nr:MAG: hypothetical protein BGO31_11935 [Bacteroidetes bacterium 43-16]